MTIREINSSVRLRKRVDFGFDHRRERRGSPLIPYKEACALIENGFCDSLKADELDGLYQWAKEGKTPRDIINSMIAQIISEAYYKLSLANDDDLADLTEYFADLFARFFDVIRFMRIKGNKPEKIAEMILDELGDHEFAAFLFGRVAGLFNDSDKESKNAQLIKNVFQVINRISLEKVQNNNSNRIRTIGAVNVMEGLQWGKNMYEWEIPVLCTVPPGSSSDSYGKPFFRINNKNRYKNVLEIIQ